MCMFMLGCMISVYAQSGQTETVYLKNGSIIKGKVIEMVPDKEIKVQTSDGSLFVYRMDEVDKVVKESSKKESKNVVDSFKFPVDASAYDLQGFRGMVEFAYIAGSFDAPELTLSLGYQFNPYFFAGIGTGIHYYVQGVNTPLIPFFADLRGNFLEGPVVPFIGLKLGYSCSIDDGFYGEGFYAAPSAGVKFMLGNRSAINLSFGYSAQKSDGINMGGFSIKAGIEF